MKFINALVVKLVDTKEAAANNGIEKCKENFPNVLDLDNNGCYIHYQKKVTQF